MSIVGTTFKIHVQIWCMSLPLMVLTSTATSSVFPLRKTKLAQRKCAYMRLTACPLLFECLGNPQHPCRRRLLPEYKYCSSRIICYKQMSYGASNNRNDPQLSIRREYKARILPRLLATNDTKSGILTFA
ncbi:hypothetical protein F5146DRAFT_53974 [Armillaria mellea]|nr:hypothetical protein F5146DRAFT_53974 [Armillaria mellea]